MSFESVLTQIAERPTWVRSIMDDQANFAIALAKRLLKQVSVDFVSFSEPIATRHGPLISPRQYRELALNSYRPILDKLRRAGVDTIVWTTYGNARPLLEDVLDAGFDTIRCYERESESMDYFHLRQQFGHSLKMIGGIDLDVLLKGPAALDKEFDHKVIPLLQQGRYIPLADGRVRANMPFTHYAYYRHRLEDAVHQADAAHTQ